MQSFWVPRTMFSFFALTVFFRQQHILLGLRIWEAEMITWVSESFIVGKKHLHEWSSHEAGRALLDLLALQAGHGISGGHLNMTRLSSCTLQTAIKLKFLGIMTQSQTLYIHSFEYWRGRAHISQACNCRLYTCLKNKTIDWLLKALDGWRRFKKTHSLNCWSRKTLRSFLSLWVWPTETRGGVYGCLTSFQTLAWTTHFQRGKRKIPIFFLQGGD